MTHRIFKSILLVSLMVFIATISVAVPVTDRCCTEMLKSELRSEAYYIAMGIEASGDEDIFVSEKLENDVALISANGELLFESGSSEVFVAYSELEEVILARQNGEGYATRYSDIGAAKTVYYALLLDNGSVLRVSGQSVSALSLLLDLTAPAVIIFFCILGAGVLIAFRSSRTIVKGVGRMADESCEEGELYGEIVPIFRTISEQKRLISRQMEELSVRRNEFDAIINNMEDGLILIDDHANIISCNQSALKVIELGLTEARPESVISVSVLSLGISGELRDIIRAALLGQKSEELIRSDEKIFHIIADPVMSEGTVKGAAILILDETEKEKREELRREFTSNISHELKTPLTSISGFAELIRSGVSGDNTLHFADNIYKETQRLIVLVNDIIKLSRLDEGSSEPKLEEIPLKEVCKNVAARLENAAILKNITISVTGEELSAVTDEEILEEIIYNLGDNSIKYGKSGGNAVISVEKRSDGRVLITVCDDGIGIPRDQLDRVFERFYRVDKSHSNSIGGTGLGLSIVKHSAARLGIELSVSSVLGEGTRISLLFP